MRLIAAPDFCDYCGKQTVTSFLANLRPNLFCDRQRHWIPDGDESNEFVILSLWLLICCFS